AHPWIGSLSSPQCVSRLHVLLEFTSHQVDSLCPFTRSTPCVFSSRGRHPVSLLQEVDTPCLSLKRSTSRVSPSIDRHLVSPLQEVNTPCLSFKRSTPRVSPSTGRHSRQENQQDDYYKD
ncbi:hypothetical protein OTU49_010652, partial [Cherax quadricarinatus]